VPPGGPSSRRIVQRTETMVTDVEEAIAAITEAIERTDL
jgi:hypothetical protein